MNSQDLSETAKSLLTKAGWFPGRRVELRDAEAALSQTGYLTFSSKVKEFLQEFEGLSAEVEVAAEQKHFAVSAKDMFQHFSKRALPPTVAPAIGTPCWPIGGISPYLFLIDADGVLYGWDDPYLVVLGRTARTGLDRVLTLRNPMVSLLLPYNDDDLKAILTQAKEVMIIIDFDDDEGYPDSGSWTADFLNDRGYNVWLVRATSPGVTDLRLFSGLDDVSSSIDVMYVDSWSTLLKPIIEFAVSHSTRLIWIEAIQEYDLKLLEYASNHGILCVTDSPGFGTEYERILGIKH